MDFILLTLIEPKGQKVLYRISDMYNVTQEEGYSNIEWYITYDGEEPSFTRVKETIEEIQSLINKSNTLIIPQFGGGG